MGKLDRYCPKKRFFWKNYYGYFFLVLIMPQNLKKNPQRVNYERHKVAWFWPKLGPNCPCLIKAFLVNWLILVWSNYCIPSYYVSKFLETELLDIISRDIRLFSSGLICARIAQTCFSTVSRLQSRFEETVSPLISGESQLMLPLSICWVPSC